MTLTLKNTNPETKGKLNVSNNKFCRNYSISSNDSQPRRLILETSLSFKNLVIQDFEKQVSVDTTTKHSDTSNILLTQARIIPEPASVVFSPRVLSPQDVAATKVQKVYKSYRTRRNLADGAVLIEELWWKTLDSASLEKSSVLFFDTEKPETAASKWARATTRAAKVGKGLLKDDKAQKLALQHWLEAIDPRHRYGHNLRLYYDIWFISESAQPFFYWLDVGDGKEINLDKCPRMKLQHQCIKYLGPKERESYEVVVENGKLVYKNSGIFVSTNEGSKWIFVLSTSRALYIGQKTKGTFQHSSFLSGAAITAAGRLVAHGGVLEAIWPYSGHYHPTEENFREFISFLEENSVDLSSVKKCSIDDDHILYNADGEESNQSKSQFTSLSGRNDLPINKQATTATNYDKNDKKTDDECMEAPVFDLAKHIPHKWSTGAGPRIRCLMDYPAELQSRALEQVNLSPRLAVAPPYNTYGPIPSPRPSPRVHLSPRLAYGHMSPPASSSSSSSSSIAKCKYVAK